jgi:DNA-binding NarL/FixJ family response regulator
LIVVDDHELARAGVRKLLEGARDIEVIAETSSGQDALRLCRELAPDLVLMDVRLADTDGLSATRLIRQAVPATRVVLFTLYEAPDYIAEAEQAGAAAYLLKGGSRTEVLDAIRRVLAARKPPLL